MLNQGRQMTAIPVCPPDNEDGTVILFPKPENCSEFYQCSGGIAFTQVCPPGLYYCEENQVCAWINDRNCSFNCTITKNIPVPVADPECPMLNDSLILYPYPDNCAQYYQCDNGDLTLRNCSPGLYFCPENAVCAWNWDPECTFNCIMPQTIPVLVEEKFDVIDERADDTTIDLPTEGPTPDPRCPPQTGNDPTFLPNPDNCNEYYECSNGVAVLMECPDDLYFCTQKNACAWRWEPGCIYDCIIVNK